MATVGEATADGDAEHLMRTIQAEEATRYEDVDCHEAHQPLGDFLDDVDPHTRLHSALGYLTPAAFETQWRQQQRAAVPVTLETP